MDVRWKKLGKASIIEIIGSLLLLLCLFLPWVSVSYKGMNSVSFSLINRALITDMFNWVYVSINEQTGWDVFNYGYLLFLFPVLCLINIVTQYIVRIPWLSFYTAVASAFAVISAYYFYKSFDRFEDISDIRMGIGLILTGIISLLFMIYVWTNLGWNYKKHWIYLAVALVWCIVSCVILDKFNSLQGVLCVLGFLHAPFLIYALLVATCSYFVHSRNH